MKTGKNSGTSEYFYILPGVEGRGKEIDSNMKYFQTLHRAEQIH